jgi:hypothetical protein
VGLGQFTWFNKLKTRNNYFLNTIIVAAALGRWTQKWRSKKLIEFVNVPFPPDYDFGPFQPSVQITNRQRVL